MRKFNYYFFENLSVVVNELDDNSVNIVYPSFCVTDSNVARNLARALIDAAHKMDLIELEMEDHND